ncbi:transposase family protein [Kitasatospora sp. NPDC091257]|uniref:transposase family protein n=1 Tax=Kitasatospora sp. NPDC091257 TaxID=3364084 RepID=UPI00381C50E4
MGRSVRVHARGRTSGASCTGCGTWSDRVHSGYERRISDTAVSGQELVLHLRVRRFFCDSAECGKRTFAEQVPGLTFVMGGAPCRCGRSARPSPSHSAAGPAPGWPRICRTGSAGTP